MKPREALDEARTFLADHDRAFPVTDIILYTRMSVRQRQLFALAATWDREYFGKKVRTGHDDGCIDLTDLEGTDLWPIERVTRIEIAEEGTSGYGRHEKVTICKSHDRYRHYKPRVLIRSHQVEAVVEEKELSDGSRESVHDLEGVEKVRIWYARRPKDLNLAFLAQNPEAKSQTDLEIGDPWGWLLVWDLVKSAVGRTVQTDAEKNDPVWQMAEMAESSLLMVFKEHVRGYAHGAEVTTG